ncbi:hypothetical protein AbraIFM66950_007638 [Aspergillus brasiliensis]|nr:hypothetical protein AbraIFM66950_007638 [Aspergillus brasiliensis]
MFDPYDDELSPYRIDAVLAIQSHSPPPPLHKREIRQDEMDCSLSLLELCLRNPPLPGSDGHSFVNIHLIKGLQTGIHKRSQVFVVRCVDTSLSSGLPTDQNMIAKFYDPLYHDSDDGNTFKEADYDYSHECASYMRLSDLQGSVIPRFFGSYTFTTQIDGHSRLVRLILIEQVNGLPMSPLDPKEFSTEERQTILKQIIDGESALFAKDVCHRDLCPRNIVIERSGPGRVRAIIIDLGSSVIGRSRNPLDSAQESRWFPGVPISPLLRWNIYYGYPDDFEDWVDWSWQEWLEFQYKETEPAITDEQRQRWPVHDWMLEFASRR